MPIKSDSEQTSNTYLRLLVLGPPKLGKTTTCITTSPPPVYVINSDDAEALRPAITLSPQPFTYDHAYGDDLQVMQRCLKEADRGARVGEYKTVVWDTITLFASRLLDVCKAATATRTGETDGRKAYPAYNENLRRILDKLLNTPAHVIVTSHYIETGPGVDGKSSTGDGIAPLLSGQSKQLVPARFQDVVFLTWEKGERVFLTQSKGAFGPGCRSLPGVEKVPADVCKLIETITNRGK